MNPLAMLNATFCDFQDFPKVRVAKNPIFKILRKFPGKMGNFPVKMGNFSEKREISREISHFHGKFLKKIVFLIVILGIFMLKSQYD